MPISYTGACAQICAAPAPILFIDTCLFLDVLRAPVRENVSADSAKFSNELCARANASPRLVWLVTSETVVQEWQDNLAGVKDEVERETLKLEKKRLHFWSAAQHATGATHQSGPSERALNLTNQLEVVSKDLINACAIISPNDSHLVGAMTRVKSNMAPARRGKSEPKDCEIFELFVCLCRDLRSAGMTEEFVFASSNTNEYGPSNSGGIQPELHTFGAKYASDLSWAMAILDCHA